ncbi:MAG: YdcF family protein [Mycobacterium sp.]|nr:YdcF family protein [Mycobacterium sp.]
MRLLSAAIGAVAIAPPGILITALWRTHRCARRAVSRAPAPAQTAVVFGTQALADRPGGVLRARLDHAIGIYRRGGVHRIAVAGGVPAFREGPSGGHDEVAVGLRYAAEHGVPVAHLIAVRPGQNTREQVASTKQLIWGEGLGPIVAVSSGYHMLRIADEAQRQGFGVQLSSPSARVDTVTWRNYAAHLLLDTVAVLWYRLPTGVTRRIDTSAGSFRHMVLLALRGDVSWRLAWRSLRRSHWISAEPLR